MIPKNDRKEFFSFSETGGETSSQPGEKYHCSLPVSGCPGFRSAFLPELHYDTRFASFA
jgi:hypothetical protein